MQTLVWSPEMALGIPGMDRAHRILLIELGRLRDAADDEAFGAHLFALIGMLEHDFREEDELMEIIDFPMLRQHRDQHARVLVGLHQVEQAMLNGDAAPAREAVALLPHWFLHHLSTMDLALAVALDLARPDMASVAALGQHQCDSPFQAREERHEG